MSTLKVSEIRNASSATGGLDIAADGVVSGALPSPNRNLLYNGAMQVAQRGTSTASITTSGYYTADRWQLLLSNLGTWTQSVENDAPTGSGFRKSLKMLCTTADAAPAAGDYCWFLQQLEGQDVQRIAKGTSSAQKLTLSFWVKSNVTGTYVVYVNDADNTRMTSFAYTISASATWEKKTIVVPADTTGAFDNDNASSLQIYWGLAAGSTYTSGTLQSAWTATVNGNLFPGQTNLAAATNNYWQITGVQLEVGDTATPFEFKSFGQELRECQRYYYLHVSGNAKAIGLGQYYSASAIISYVKFPETMRSDPSLSVASGTDYYLVGAGGDGFNSFTINRANTEGAFILNSTEVSGTLNAAGHIYTNNAASSVAFSAEL